MRGSYRLAVGALQERRHGWCARDVREFGRAHILQTRQQQSRPRKYAVIRL